MIDIFSPDVRVPSIGGGRNKRYISFFTQLHVQTQRTLLVSDTQMGNRDVTGPGARPRLWPHHSLFVARKGDPGYDPALGGDAQLVKVPVQSVAGRILHRPELLGIESEVVGVFTRRADQLPDGSQGLPYLDGEMTLPSGEVVRCQIYNKANEPGSKRAAMLSFSAPETMDTPTTPPPADPLADKDEKAVDMEAVQDAF